MLDALSSGNADILIGTQSVVKGLDLPGVTLPAVMIADIGLSLPHFRAGERTFQLITQLIGRSGRFRPGEVIIQTYRPDAAEIRRAVFHETEQYLSEELALRSDLGYPPRIPMIRILFRGPHAQTEGKTAYEKLSQLNKIGAKISLSPTLSGGGRVWHLLIRGESARALIAAAHMQNAVVDIDPLECI